MGRTYRGAPDTQPGRLGSVVGAGPEGRPQWFRRGLRTDVYCCCMKRTQIYISEEQEREIAARAHDAGVSKAEVIRRLLDDGLGINDGTEARERAIDETFGILPDAPDWQEWLASVRGSSADERLRRLDR